MKRLLLALAIVSAVVASIPVAASAKITKQNPAGHQVSQQSQGQAITSVNPAGHAPPGQNK
jgi:hypothetical protein